MMQRRQRGAADWPARLILLILFAGLTLHFLATHRPATNVALAAIAPPELPAAVRALAAADVERAVARLHFDASGQLVIDTETESILGAAAEVLPVEPDADALARLGLLLRKQFPPEQGEQVETLLHGYLNYRRAKLAWLEHASEPRNIAEEAERFATLSALQDRELGASLANRLYGEHRRLAEQMFAVEHFDGETGDEY